MTSLNVGTDESKVKDIASSKVVAASDDEGSRGSIIIITTCQYLKEAELSISDIFILDN